MGIGRPFRPGNKAGKGRPPGRRNRRKEFQEVLEKDAERIIERIKTEALNSNGTAMRLCMERLLPVAKAENARFELPAVESGESLAAAIAAIARAVAEGVLNAQEGESMAKVVESQRRNLEAGAFEVRLTALEKTVDESARKLL